MRDTEFYRAVDAEIATLKAKLSKLETVLALRNRFVSLQVVADSADLPTPARVQFIANVVCAKFDLRFTDLLAHKRGTRIDEARTIIFHLCWLEGFDRREIGRIFARTHSAVFYGASSARERASVDPKFAALIESLKKAISVPLVSEPPATSNTITITHRAA